MWRTSNVSKRSNDMTCVDVSVRAGSHSWSKGMGYDGPTFASLREVVLQVLP